MIVESIIEFKKATMWILPTCIGFVVGAASVFIPVLFVTASKRKKVKKKQAESAPQDLN